MVINIGFSAEFKGLLVVEALNHLNFYGRKMVKWSKVEYQPHPLNTSHHSTLSSSTLWTPFPLPLCILKTPMSKAYDTRSHTCLTQPSVWTQGSNRANYWPRWALIRLLPSGFCTAASTEQNRGVSGGRTDGRVGGAGALQLKVRSGDDLPPSVLSESS